MGQTKDSLRLGRLGSDMRWGAVATDAGVKFYDSTRNRPDLFIDWFTWATLSSRCPFDGLLAPTPKRKKPPGP